MFSCRKAGRCISTHALTEGDPAPLYSAFPAYISTHALTEGDLLSEPACIWCFHFNSRPHGGRQGVDACDMGQIISTHALTEGDRSWFRG